jgi:hypothetical protein
MQGRSLRAVRIYQADCYPKLGATRRARLKPACGARAFLRKILRAASFSGRLGEAIPALRAATEDRRYVFMPPPIRVSPR